MSVGAGPSGWREAVVDAVLRRTDRVVSVFLARDTVPAHRAGQHVDVRLVAEDGYEARRSYSIASAPGSDRVELMIERLDDGEVSPFFHEVVRAGDVIEWRGPIGGHFVWTPEIGGPLLLVAGGSGIAPLMAMLRHRAAVAPQVEVALLYSVRHWDDMVCRDELLAAAQRDAAFRLIVATTREAARRAGDHGRRIDHDMARELLGRVAGATPHIYVCGSTGFVEAANSALVAAGAAPPSIRAERYGGVA